MEYSVMGHEKKVQLRNKVKVIDEEIEAQQH